MLTGANFLMGAGTSRISCRICAESPAAQPSMTCDKYIHKTPMLHPDPASDPDVSTTLDVLRETGECRSAARDKKSAATAVCAAESAARRANGNSNKRPLAKDADTPVSKKDKRTQSTPPTFCSDLSACEVCKVPIGICSNNGPITCMMCHSFICPQCATDVDRGCVCAMCQPISMLHAQRMDSLREYIAKSHPALRMPPITFETCHTLCDYIIWKWRCGALVGHDAKHLVFHIAQTNRRGLL